MDAAQETQGYETRRIDDLGRVAIPKWMRKQMGITEGDTLRIMVVDGYVRIEKEGTDNG